MTALLTPDNEKQRVKALRELNILDTAPEERFDRFTRLAKALFNVPMSTFSLIDSHRQWFKSKQGLDACETSREVSFCTHTILSEEILYVPDATKDPRFADNPFVTGPANIRMYAGAPLTIGDGYRIGTLCIVDVTPRHFSREELAVLRDLADCLQQEINNLSLRQAEQIIQDQEARLHALVNTVADGILVIDQKGQIQTANPAAEKLFGYTIEDIINRHIDEIIPPHNNFDHTLSIGASEKSAANTITTTACEVIGKHKGGATFPVELSINEMDVNGETMFTGIVRDITERKEIERMKNEFVSTVSHELRTPLTSIRGALGVVLGKAADTLTPKVRHLLETANRNSERLTLLINDILDLEKIESGKLEFEYEVIDLMDISTTALETNEEYAYQHNVSLKIDSTLEHAFVLADSLRLLQVYTNLISNAVKFSPQGDWVEISVNEYNDGYRVSVHDNGRGIPKEFRERIFQRFAQVDSSDSREKGGTGLGLSITKAIIERLDGLIDYESTPESGTTFYFDIPKYQATEKITQANPLSSSILICEDNTTITKRLVNLLEHECLSSVTASTAKDAENLLSKSTYRLLIMDLSMFDKKGMELIKNTQGHCPVIIYSDAKPDKHTNIHIAAALTISDTSDTQLLSTIKNVLHI